MSLRLQVSGFVVLIVWFMTILLSPPGYIEAFKDPNSNFSACHFCDDDVDFSARNLLCCLWGSRCCGDDGV